MSRDETLRVIATELDALLVPLREAFGTPDMFSAFMRHLGWECTAIPPCLLGLSSAIENVAKGVESYLDDGSVSAEDVIRDWQVLLDGIKNIANESNGNIPAMVNADEFRKELPSQLLRVAVSTYLLNDLSLVAAVLGLLGVLSTERVAISGTRPSYDEVKVDWRGLFSLLCESLKPVAKAYGWGDSNFRGELLLKRMAGVMAAAGWGPLFGELPDGVKAFLARGAIHLEPVHDWILLAPLYQCALPERKTLFGVGVSVLPESDAAPPGLAVLVCGAAGASVEFELAEGLTARARAEGELSGLGLLVRPGKPIEAFSGAWNAAGSAFSPAAGGRLHLELETRRPDGSPRILLATAIGLVTVQAVRMEMEAIGDTEEEDDLYAQCSFQQVSIAITPGDATDSFVSALVPKAGLSTILDLAVRVDRSGLRFGGSGGLEVRLPIHVRLGPIQVLSVKLGIKSDATALSFGFGGEIAGAFGPVNVVLEDLGLRATVDPQTLGLSMIVERPTVTGLSIDSGAVVGAGFLEFDEANEQYAGALALKAGEIALSAIGLITTKMPDGSKGFSLLISICATFNPPIQLAFGFSLAGVGGLIGVHRTMDVEALRIGVKNRTLDSILFPDPETIIPNAAKIISDMQAVFPAREGRFVVGPMVKIGWGSPAIITADIGIFIELPEPVRVVLLGQLEAILPDKTSSVVVIHLDVVGVLNVAKSELTFQATLYDSRVLNYPIYGDSAFLLGWGDDPRFALSLGGFHPSFTPPAPPTVFANLGRLTIALSSGSDLQLTCAGYLALTPNTLQFGARVDLYAKASGARIRGMLAFDTLIHFSPFSFEVAMAASVRISYKGEDLAAVDLTMLLSGPTPWLARGKAKIDVLFISVTVKFSIQWGQEQKASLPAVDPLQDVGMGVLAVMRMPSSWSAALPAGKSVVEALSPEQSADNLNDIVVHPLGRLEVRQKVPLGINLAKAGNAPVIGHDWIDITHATINGAEAECVPVEDAIARGQWEDLGDRALSVPSFEKLKTGVVASLKSIKVCGTDAVSGKEADPLSASIEYESVLINADKTASPSPKQAPGKWSDVEHIVRARAERQEALAAGPQRRFAVPRGRAQLKVKEEGFGIASAGNMTRTGAESRSATPSRRMTRFEADQSLQSARGQVGDDVADRLVVPECEVAT